MPNKAKRSATKDDFPETQTEVLAQAAAGEWTAFFAQYLRPCWREVVLACRQRNLPLEEAEDVYQELIVRLLRDGTFNAHARQLLTQGNEDSRFRANLPGRFLKYRELPLPSARFRTYLKQAIRKIVLETIRKSGRRPHCLSAAQWSSVEPWVEQSVSSSLDRRWLAHCLVTAAMRLREQSLAARTRARRRLFEALYLSAVCDWSSQQIAARFEVDRTTAVHLLRAARTRFMLLLQQVTGIYEPQELRAMLTDNIDQIRSALSKAYKARRTRGLPGTKGA
jgi:DNA-directed RNA polymerase specialized sigma24 family protein